MPESNKIEQRKYWYSAKLARIVDGDTMYLIIDLGFGCKLGPIPFRVFDLDTHESSRRIRKGVKCSEAEAASGKDATRFARVLLHNTQIQVRTYKDGQDVYGRYLAEVWYKGGSAPWRYYADEMKAAGFDREVNPL